MHSHRICINWSHLPVANFRIYTARMPPLRQRGTPLQFRRRPYRHGWTEKELNLLSHFRKIHGWDFKQIRKVWFPSLSYSSLHNAYRRLSAEERTYRSLTTNFSTEATATNRRRSFTTRPKCSSIESGPCHLYTYIPTPRSESSIEDSIESKSSAEDGVEISHNKGKNRYNLRPQRPTTFPQREAQYLVDRLRFPHFFKSYKHHLKSDGLSDRDYSPPSHTPTPEPSDRSPSVVSTQLSEASSLDLFGLEPRSPRLSSLEPSINSVPFVNASSPEFFSAEEHHD